MIQDFQNDVVPQQLTHTQALFAAALTVAAVAAAVAGHPQAA